MHLLHFLVNSDHLSSFGSHTSLSLVEFFFEYARTFRASAECGPTNGTRDLRLYFPLPPPPPIDNGRDEMRERAPKIEIHDDDGDGGRSFGAEKVQFAFLLLLLLLLLHPLTTPPHSHARTLAHSLGSADSFGPWHRRLGSGKGMHNCSGFRRMADIVTNEEAQRPSVIISFLWENFRG